MKENNKKRKSNRPKDYDLPPPMADCANHPPEKVFDIFRVRFVKCLFSLASNEEDNAWTMDNGRMFVPNFVQYLTSGKEKGLKTRSDARDEILEAMAGKAETEAFLRTSDFVRFGDVPYKRIMNLLYFGRRDPITVQIISKFAAEPLLDVLSDAKIFLLMRRMPGIYNQYMHEAMNKDTSGGKGLRGVVCRGVNNLTWTEMVLPTKKPDSISDMLRSDKDDLDTIFSLVDRLFIIYRYSDTKKYPDAAVDYLGEFKRLVANIAAYREEYKRLYDKYNSGQKLQPLHSTILRGKDMEIINGIETMNRMTPSVAGSIMKAFHDGKIYTPSRPQPPAVFRGLGSKFR
jgi:hypothetical protein